MRQGGVGREEVTALWPADVARSWAIRVSHNDTYNYPQQSVGVLIALFLYDDFPATSDTDLRSVRESGRQFRVEILTFVNISL